MSAPADVTITIDTSRDKSDNDKDDKDKYGGRNKQNPLMHTTSSTMNIPSATPAQLGMWKIIHNRQKRRSASIELALHSVFTIIFVVIISLQRYDLTLTQ